MTRSTRASTATSTRASRSAEKQRQPQAVVSPARGGGAATRPTSSKTSPRTAAQRQKGRLREKQNGRAADSDGGSSKEEELSPRTAGRAPTKRAHGDQESPQLKKTKLAKDVPNGIAENGVAESSEEEETSCRPVVNGQPAHASSSRQRNGIAKSRNQTSKNVQSNQSATKSNQQAVKNNKQASKNNQQTSSNQPVSKNSQEDSKKLEGSEEEVEVSTDDEVILTGISRNSKAKPLEDLDVDAEDVEEISSDSEEGEDDADDEDDEDEDEDDEIQFMGMDDQKVGTSKNTTEEVSTKDTAKVLKRMKREYEDLLKQKDEEIERLQNHLQYKDQQMDSLNDLVNQNMELEAKVNAILGSKEIYEEEVKKLAAKTSKPSVAKKKTTTGKANETHTEENKQKSRKGRTRALAEVAAQDSDSDIEVVEEKSEKKRKMNRSPIEVVPDDEGKEEEEEEEEKVTGKKGKKRPRRSRRTKVVEEEEEKIEALFVSDDEDDDIKEIMRPSKKTRGKKTEKTEEKEETKDKSKKGAKEHSSDKEEEDGTEDKGRHNIRKLMGDKKLKEETKAAAIEEKERIERIAKLKEKHQIISHMDSKTKQPVYTKMVLAFKKDQTTPLVDVNTKILRKLKPHQVDAIEFLWDSMIETVDAVKQKEPGSGCILAHCMGLGKTLSVISFVHTMLTHKILKLKTCLVVCPLNTVLNWQYEWSKWLDKKDRLPTYELASAKDNHTRANILTKWHKEGGVLIMGYQLFRILATSTTKSKKKKKIFDETLIDQGADIIVCDEGHVLKNDASAISKCMNKVRSKRRIVLTGTPLQNNLIEYHCMVSFVKPNLLGTRKEFSNRFVNPITNGQHADSTPFDVKVMKRRAHVLHKMLSGCVQRRDYSSLTKFLPPKSEYIVYIRLSPLQIKLYEKFIEQNRVRESPMFRGTSLFSDYQALMRIWTHPWVLKMDEIRQEKKMTYTEDDDDELGSFLASDSSEVAEELSEELDASETTSKSSHEVPVQDKQKKEEKKEEEKEEKEPEMPLRRTRRSTTAATQESAKKSGKQNNNSKAENMNKKTMEDSDSDVEEIFPEATPQRAKLVAGEVIKHWQTESRRRGVDEVNPEPRKPEEQWWTSMINEAEHKNALELSGKLVVLMDILRMAEGLGDKVLVFSQSLLSLDLIEDFLGYKNEEAEKLREGKKGKRASSIMLWKKDEDFCRMDGSTSAVSRTKFTNTFNCVKNKRMRLFLISTKAGGLGINLDSANRVIIFDASWNPSHDIQSIFRAYRFGQEKNVYIYRFLAQGTMEEKIYERQVQKETLAQRVIDEHQLDSHFTASDLQDLYKFEPDRLDDPNRKERPTPKVPSDIILAELLSERKDWVVGFHEHDSLLERRPDENLNEEERKAAWDDYEKEKQGFMFQYRNPTPTVSTFNYTYRPNAYMHKYPPGESRPPVVMRAAQPQHMTHMQQMQQQAQQQMQQLQAQAQLQVQQQAQGRVQDAMSVAGGGLLPPGTSSEQAKLNFQLSQLPRVVQEILKYNPDITPSELQNRLRAFMGMHTRYSNVPGFAMLNQAGMLGQPGVGQQPSVGQQPTVGQQPSVGQPGMVLPNTSGSSASSSSNASLDLSSRALAAAAAAEALASAPPPGAQSSPWPDTATPSPAQLSQAIKSSIAAAASSAMPSRLPQPGRVPANQR